MLDRIAPQRNTKTAGERDGDPSRTEYAALHLNGFCLTETA
jgi:hypothetical protein